MIVPNETFIKAFKETNGALSVAESIAILNLARQVPEGVFIELGTFAGKSAMSAAQGLPNGTFYLVDPIFAMDENVSPNNKEPFLLQGGKFCDNIVEQVAKNKILPVLIGDYSVNVIPRYTGYSWVFVDSGSHQDGLPMEEVLLLEDRVVPGGIICFHDFGSQFREPKEAAEYLVDTGKYEWVTIDWERILNYVKVNDLESGNNSWHKYPELPHSPNFVGAVKRK